LERICIGVHVHAEPERLRATLAHLEANTTRPVQLLLLPDGADAPTREALRVLQDLPQSGTKAALGAPACFNRLARESDAGLLILLESGSLVGPNWLEPILSALAAEPRNGLAGPSTNRAWSLQGAFPRDGNGEQAIAATAAEAAARFGTGWRTLEPLYGLADFCYAVRREVVAAVGAADEGYGPGPCWEMDYTIRAVRAGFQAVWAQGSYVYRHPLTARRRREEQNRLTANKHRYQDKFCGLLLRGSRTEYASHCRGDSCRHFAPADRIGIHISLASAKRSVVEAKPRPCPLVSCIMPTRDRPDWVLQAITYFQRQDYPERELVIVDDGATDLSDRMSAAPGIRYIRLPRPLSIGAKRNLACELANGPIIAHWDDDDWYGPNRLRLQVEPLLADSADITGLFGTRFLDLERWEFWSCTQRLHRRLFVHDVHGGTLVFRRRVFEQLARYPDISLAEDAAFLRQAVSRGARLGRVAGDDLFLYLRHGTNSWRFSCGRHVDPGDWQRIPKPSLPEPDRFFYAARSPAAPRSEVEPVRVHASPSTAMPMVSCIMPTSNRRTFVPKAIEYFLRQGYPRRELLIVDDGDDAVGDLMPDDPTIRYFRLETRHTVGAKRNLACAESRGDLIVHWDDDDWMADWRIEYQVTDLRRNGAEICGLDTVLFYDPDNGQLWRYRYPRRKRPLIAGGSLCYSRDLWHRNPFADRNLGEDSSFVLSHRATDAVVHPDNGFYVALIHPGNTNPRRTSGERWSACDDGFAKDILGTDWPYYQSRKAVAFA
jgi:O-antigen biosynthesis protein